MGQDHHQHNVDSIGDRRLGWAIASTCCCRIAERYYHESLRIGGMDCPTCVTAIEYALGRMDGVLEAAVGYGTKRPRLELDTEKTLFEVITQRIRSLICGMVMYEWFTGTELPSEAVGP